MVFFESTRSDGIGIDHAPSSLWEVLIISMNLGGLVAAATESEERAVWIPYGSGLADCVT